jgi:hypothetical protein
LIIRGIRLGLTDVIPVEADPRPLLRRINALLRPGQVTGADEELTPADLEAVERVLTLVDQSDRDHAPDSAETKALAVLRDELLSAAKARAALETKLERAQHEKRALEQELKTLLAQNVDQAKLQTELEALQAQREMADLAQHTINEKARQLAATRAKIAAERSALALEVERARLKPAGPVALEPNAARDLDLEWSRVEAIRADLHEGEDEVRQAAARVQQESTQLARERRRWHEDLDLLRAREENLGRYEDRLRRLQAELEAGQLSGRAQQGAEPRGYAVSPFRDDVQVRAAWEKLQRANELLEAERAMFRDERMALQDLQKTILRRQDELRAIERQLVERDGVRRALPQPGGTAKAGGVGAEERPSRLRIFTRAPLAMLGRGKA